MNHVSSQKIQWLFYIIYSSNKTPNSDFTSKLKHLKTNCGYQSDLVDNLAAWYFIEKISNRYKAKYQSKINRFHKMPLILLISWRKFSREKKLTKIFRGQNYNLKGFSGNLGSCDNTCTKQVVVRNYLQKWLPIKEIQHLTIK